jgi:flagellar biosynthesis GTPase FlhF
MERTEILDLMGELKLFGMRGAFDEVMANGLKRRHEPQQIIGELLKAEVAEKEARSIKYELTIAKLPLAKDLTDFDFKGTPINAALVRDLATGGFLAQQRNVVLIGGTGSGKSETTCGCSTQSLASANEDSQQLHLLPTYRRRNIPTVAWHLNHSDHRGGAVHFIPQPRRGLG